MRALWGKDRAAGSPVVARGDSSGTLIKTWRDSVHDTPTLLYCWGLNNYKKLQEAGLKPILLGVHPYHNWSGNPDTPEAPKFKGVIRYGVSMWLHKLKAVKEALKEHEQVLWLDGDVQQMRELPKQWWRLMQRGAPYRASLSRYKQPQCLWRKDRVARTLVPYGGIQYFRRDWIDVLIDYQFYEDRTMSDEIAIMKFLDALHGGWIGVERWAKTYELPCCFHHRGHRQPVRRRGALVFKNVGRY